MENKGGCGADPEFGGNGGRKSGVGSEMGKEIVGD
jgi:hypothetical protein